jgi:hypothetical protein
MSPSGTTKLFVELGQPVSWADKKLQLQNSTTVDKNFNANFIFFKLFTAQLTTYSYRLDMHIDLKNLLKATVVVRRAKWYDILFIECISMCINNMTTNFGRISTTLN